MSLIKMLEDDRLNVIYYTNILTNAENAIVRIKEFTTCSQFQEADNILLEIKLQLLDKNFENLLQCKDFLLQLNFLNDNFKNIEDIFTETKVVLMRKQLSNLENQCWPPTIKPLIDRPKFDGNQDDYKAFINVFNDTVEKNTDLSIAQKINYLKSSLSGVALGMVKDIEPKYDDIYKKMLAVLKQRFDSGNNAPSQSEVSAQEQDSKVPHDKNPTDISYSNEKDLADELYNSIVHATYSNAIKVTRHIYSRNLASSIITKVVLKLAKEGNRNLLSYVYQLWSNSEKDIVDNYMPETFKMIFGDWVIPVQKEYGLALKMDANTDRDGDRIVWGDSTDKTSRRVIWRLFPFWQDNRVCFHIQNMEHNMYLKLEIRPDNIGDRGAFGSKDKDTARHAWILEPVEIDEKICFYIINVEYNQGLKLQMSTDDMVDRKLWGHNGNIYRDPSHFAWSIECSYHLL